MKKILNKIKEFFKETRIKDYLPLTFILPCWLLLVIGNFGMSMFYILMLFYSFITMSSITIFICKVIERIKENKKRIREETERIRRQAERNRREEEKRRRELEAMQSIGRGVRKRRDSICPTHDEIRDYLEKWSGITYAYATKVKEDDDSQFEDGFEE